MHRQISAIKNALAAHQSGFTLVEIALTLAVTGLLIGGALKGQELILNTKLKRIEIEYTNISTAVVTYQNRHAQLPGDDPFATPRFSVFADGINDPTPLQINGDGDGSIDGDWIAVAHSETSNFWKHLRASGLLTGDSDDASQPQNDFGGLIGIRNGSLRLAGQVVIFGNIEGTIAGLIDARRDDASPASGRAQSDVTEALMNNNVISSAGTNYNNGAHYHLAISL